MGGTHAHNKISEAAQHTDSKMFKMNVRGCAPAQPRMKDVGGRLGGTHVHNEMSKVAQNSSLCGTFKDARLLPKPPSLYRALKLAHWAENCIPRNPVLERLDSVENFPCGGPFLPPGPLIKPPSLYRGLKAPPRAIIRQISEAAQNSSLCGTFKDAHLLLALPCSQRPPGRSTPMNEDVADALRRLVDTLTFNANRLDFRTDAANEAKYFVRPHQDVAPISFTIPPSEPDHLAFPSMESFEAKDPDAHDEFLKLCKHHIAELQQKHNEQRAKATREGRVVITLSCTNQDWHMGRLIQQSLQPTGRHQKALSAPGWALALESMLQKVLAATNPTQKLGEGSSQDRMHQE
ncbi:hypothetical protein OH77DRAFT_1514018 [Trametes cingulata]|nr:hypothetical protein OH77DRAFT_1514018 [Trametes cingulata]